MFLPGQCGLYHRNRRMSQQAGMAEKHMKGMNIDE